MVNKLSLRLADKLKKGLREQSFLIVNFMRDLAVIQLCIKSVFS